jgi:hypothetical protein
MNDLNAFFYLSVTCTTINTIVSSKPKLGAFKSDKMHGQGAVVMQLTSKSLHFSSMNQYSEKSHLKSVKKIRK